MNVLRYRLLHGLRVRPWESAARRGDSPRILGSAFDREQEGLAPPFGRALDLGCGTGVHSVDLARRGWQVTGVDFVPGAIRSARARSDAAGVQIRWLVGDVTDLPAEVGTGYKLILDFGAFHGLTAPQRHAEARQVDTVAAGDATLLMVAFAPAKRGPLPRGASAADITAAFSGWEITDDSLLTPWPGPIHLYRLRRTGSL
ncbi:SAM-dependent methyltransferase [Nocardia sp. GAS34]|uniref:class I SAM-dependent methyltransferase n=1 Tax=unclassified Nocardia TaxID=2637762 RepID=UPI003D1FBB4E